MGILDNIQSLRGVNEWITYIDSNIDGAKRVSYKGTKPTISDGITRVGEPSLLGIPRMPATTLVVTSTSLDWTQGEITPSESTVHFALNGRGFFVLADSFGRSYLTRDGEFHWDENGYLENSSGLKVLGKGQTFIRGTDGCGDFSIMGESVDLDTYGNKTLMVVDVATPDGLQFSQYGSTIFSTDGFLPFPVENNFSTTMDGVNSYSDPGTFYIDTGKLRCISSDARTLVAEALPIKDFTSSVDMQLTGGVANDWIGVMFGQNSVNDDYVASPGVNASGYTVRLLNNAGTWDLQLYNNTTGTIVGAAVPTTFNPTIAEVNLQITVKNGFISAMATSGANVFNLPPTAIALYQGNMSLRHVSAAGDATYDNLMVNPYRKYSADRIGSFIGEHNSLTKLATCAADFEETSVVGQALEASNTTISEYIPMLSIAQKMYSSIAKLINVYTSMQDDLNGFFR